MNVCICILLFNFTIFVSCAFRYPLKLWDLRNCEYHVDATSRQVSPAPASGSRIGLLRDTEDRLYTVDQLNRVVPHDSQFYTLFDARGRFYDVTCLENQIELPLEPAEIGLVLVDLNRCHYIVQEDGTVVPANVVDGPMPPPTHPINHDIIVRNGAILGDFLDERIIPENEDGPPYDYVPQPGDKVVRFRNWSHYVNGQWCYLAQ